MIQTSCRHYSDIIQISSTFYQILCSQSRMTAIFISFAFFCLSPARTPRSSGWPHTLRPQPNVRLATCDRCGGDRKNIAPPGSSHNSSHRLVHFLVFRIPRQGFTAADTVIPLAICCDYIHTVIESFRTIIEARLLLQLQTENFHRLRRTKSRGDQPAGHQAFPQ